MSLPEKKTVNSFIAYGVFEGCEKLVEESKSLREVGYSYFADPKLGTVYCRVHGILKKPSTVAELLRALSKTSPEFIEKVYCLHLLHAGKDS